METMSEKPSASGVDGASTQKFVNVEEIKDGVVVLRNGSLRAILMVSSINFDLKSVEEQDTIISQYQNFLNSIDFPAQVVISSRKLNIEPYLDFLGEKEKQQRNELLRLQISEYRNFIKNLTEVSNIMTKYFYIVIPFAPIESNHEGFFAKVSAMFNPKQVVSEQRERLETYKNQLWQRVDHVIAALSGTGVRITPLKTEEIIELLYNSYNPSLFTSTIIKDLDKVELSEI